MKFEVRMKKGMGKKVKLDCKNKKNFIIVLVSQ